MIDTKTHFWNIVLRSPRGALSLWFNTPEKHDLKGQLTSYSRGSLMEGNTLEMFDKISNVIDEF